MHSKIHGLIACLLLLPSCSKSEAPTTTAKTNNANYSSGNPITAPVDYLGAVGKAKQTSVKVVDVSTLSRAVQAFRAGEDRLPTDLNELVKEGYMPKIPPPPAGMRYQYNPQTGEVRAVR